MRGWRNPQKSNLGAMISHVIDRTDPAPFGNGQIQGHRLDFPPEVPHTPVCNGPRNANYAQLDITITKYYMSQVYVVINTSKLCSLCRDRSARVDKTKPMKRDPPKS